MLEFINFETLNKTKLFTTDILLNFKDKGIYKAKCFFIKNRLDNYNLYLDSKFSMTYETEYDDSKETLSMRIVISIPDRLIPKDPNKLNQLIMISIESFRQYHERTIQFLKNKNEILA